MLAVVQHEQQAPAPKRGGKGGPDRLARIFLHAQGCRDSLGHQGTIRQGGKLDQVNAGRILCDTLDRDREPQPGLPDAAGTGQREQSAVGEQAPDLAALRLPADERGELNRQPRLGLTVAISRGVTAIVQLPPSPPSTSYGGARVKTVRSATFLRA